MAQACEGIRVLDFTHGMAGALATMVLADYGAEVLRVEPAGGDPGWSDPAYLLWNRGKKSIDLDLRSQGGKAAAHRLAQTVDVVVECFRPGVSDKLGIGHKELAALNPALVYCSITGFGSQGPYKNLKGYDGIAMAKAGRMKDQQGWSSGRPIYRAIQDASYGAAMLGVQGILAALRARSVTGRGQKVETSLLQATTCLTSPWMLRDGEPPPTEDPVAAVPATQSASGGLSQCKDGRWIQFSNIQPNLYKASIHELGFDWIYQDERFKGAPAVFPDDASKAELNRLMKERMKEKTSDEWMELFIANGDVAAEVERTTQECLRHPQFVQNGHQIEIDDPRVGRMIQVGPLAKMSETPAIIKMPAPTPGEDTKEVLAGLNGHEPAIQPTGKSLRHPLEGITVLELANWYAAPFGATLLADLGARIIKIEQLAGDSYRGMSTNESMFKAMQGKESIVIDLKTDRGQEILHKLVAKADLLMHNMRPNVPPRLGFDYDTLHKINPRLVYLYAGSYGSTGPHSHRPAFNPTMGAIAGTCVYQSGEGNPPMGDSPTGAPDPISAVGVATALMLGLTARLRTGSGQYAETTMMNSNVYCNSEDALDYPGKPPRRIPDKEQFGLEATYRLYETKDGWVFFATPLDDDFQAFCQAVGRDDLAKDPRFSTAAKRYEHRAGLGQTLAPMFKTRTADEWESLLTSKDIGCVRADSMGHRRFLHTDPHARETNFMVLAEHPALGKYWRVGPRVHFSDTPSRLGPYCDLGEHTKDVMKELGYTQEEIEGLKEAGVINWPAQSVQAMAAKAP